MSYAVPKTRGNSTAEWKWHPKTPKKAKKHQKCHIFPGFQKIPVPYFFVNCFWNVPHRRFKRCMNRQWYVLYDLDFVLHHCEQSVKIRTVQHHRRLSWKYEAVMGWLCDNNGLHSPTNEHHILRFNQNKYDLLYCVHLWIALGSILCLWDIITCLCITKPMHRNALKSYSAWLWVMIWASY